MLEIALQSGVQVFGPHMVVLIPTFSHGKFTVFNVCIGRVFHDLRLSIAWLIVYVDKLQSVYMSKTQVDNLPGLMQFQSEVHVALAHG